MLTPTHEVNNKGKKQQLPAFRLDDVVVVTKGTLIRLAQIFDEYWVAANALPDLRRILQQLSSARDNRPDRITIDRVVMYKRLLKKALLEFLDSVGIAYFDVLQPLKRSMGDQFYTNYSRHAPEQDRL